MRINDVSSFPSKIDELIYYEDVSLDTLPLMKTFQSLIDSQDLVGAAQFLDEHNTLYGQNASLWNAMQNRLYATQKYILEHSNANNISVSSEEPTNVTNNFTWISE